MSYAIFGMIWLVALSLWPLEPPDPGSTQSYGPSQSPVSGSWQHCYPFTPWLVLPTPSWGYPPPSILMLLDADNPNPSPRSSAHQILEAKYMYKLKLYQQRVLVQDEHWTELTNQIKNCDCVCFYNDYEGLETCLNIPYIVYIELKGHQGVCFLPTSKTLDLIERTKDRTEKSLPQTGLDPGFHSAQLCGFRTALHGRVERLANLEYFINSTFWIEILGNIVHRLLPFEYLRICPRSVIMKNSFNIHNTVTHSYLRIPTQLHRSDPSPLLATAAPLPLSTPLHCLPCPIPINTSETGPTAHSNSSSTSPRPSPCIKLIILLIVTTVILMSGAVEEDEEYEPGDKKDEFRDQKDEFEDRKDKIEDEEDDSEEEEDEFEDANDVETGSSPRNADLKKEHDTEEEPAAAAVIIKQPHEEQATEVPVHVIQPEQEITSKELIEEEHEAEDPVVELAVTVKQPQNTTPKDLIAEVPAHVNPPEREIPPKDPPAEAPSTSKNPEEAADTSGGVNTDQEYVDVSTYLDQTLGPLSTIRSQPLLTSSPLTARPSRRTSIARRQRTNSERLDPDLSINSKIRRLRAESESEAKAYPEFVNNKRTIYNSGVYTFSPEGEVDIILQTDFLPDEVATSLEKDINVKVLNSSGIESLTIIEIRPEEHKYIEATLGLINNVLRSKGLRGELNCCLASRYSPGSGTTLPRREDFDTTSRSPTAALTLGGTRNIYLTARTSNITDTIDGMVRLNNGSLAFMTDNAMEAFHHSIQADKYIDNNNGGLHLVFIERTLQQQTRHKSLEKSLRIDCLNELAKERPYIKPELCRVIIQNRVTKADKLLFELQAMGETTDGKVGVKRDRLCEALNQRIMERQPIPESLTRHIVTALSADAVTEEAIRLGIQLDHTQDDPIPVPELRVRLIEMLAPGSTHRRTRTRSSSTIRTPKRHEEQKIRQTSTVPAETLAGATEEEGKPPDQPPTRRNKTPAPGTDNSKTPKTKPKQVEPNNKKKDLTPEALTTRATITVSNQFIAQATEKLDMKLINYELASNGIGPAPGETAIDRRKALQELLTKNDFTATDTQATAKDSQADLNKTQVQGLERALMKIQED